MFSLKSEKKKFKPTLFIDKFYKEKMGIIFSFSYPDHACLSKYFPKYCKHISFERERLTGALESKIKRLKIVRGCIDWTSPLSDEKTFKKLFLTNRKTFKKIPIYGNHDDFQSLSLCTYFPGVKSINLNQANPFVMHYDPQLNLNKSTLKGIKSSFGYFWSGCRFVESLKVSPYYEFDLVIIKKMDSSKRFLSFLKKLELEILVTHDRTETSRKLLENRNFLRHVTHLEIGDFYETKLDWELMQSLIDCCPQLCSFSFPTGTRRDVLNQDSPDKDFCLNLSSLQNLQVFEMKVNHFRTFITGIQFPPFIQEISLSISDTLELDSTKEFFDCQEAIEDDGMSEEQDVRDWESFEKSRMLGEFFEKWKRLTNLRILNLSFSVNSDMDTFVRNFAFPLLRMTPYLETMCYQFKDQQFEIPQEYRRKIDLDEFFSGIESLQSLKHLKIRTNNYVFSGLSQPQNLSLLSNLSSIELDARINSDFDLKRFFNAFFCSKKNQVIKKDLKLSSLNIYSTQNFIRLLNLVHSISDFKNFQANLEIMLNLESFDDICSNFKYPIYVANNIELTVRIRVDGFAVREEDLISEEKQYFEMIFGQLKLIDFRTSEEN